MTERPPIGQRVRVRGNTGIPGVAGRTGTVIAHHEDGIAVRVNLDIGDQLLCDPVNLLDLPARLSYSGGSKTTYTIAPECGRVMKCGDAL